jgi:prepilin-type N-terminal cleavage/methylation domain-containing protein
VVSKGVFILGRRGFSVIELLVVMAVIGAVGATTVASMITYWRAATTKAAAQELASGLNSARQLALAKARSVCVEVAGGAYRFRVGGCGSPAWLGPGTDPTGLIRLANNATLTTNANPVFTYLGAAVPAATMTVTNPQGGGTLRVVVSGSGRVEITP